MPIIDMAASMADYQSRIKRLEEVLIYVILGNRRRKHQQREAHERVRNLEELIRVRKGGT